MAKVVPLRVKMICHRAESIGTLLFHLQGPVPMNAEKATWDRRIYNMDRHKLRSAELTSSYIIKIISSSPEHTVDRRRCTDSSVLARGTNNMDHQKVVVHSTDIFPGRTSGREGKKIRVWVSPWDSPIEAEAWTTCATKKLWSIRADTDILIYKKYFVFAERRGD